jgi:hypothetical protein
MMNAAKNLRIPSIRKDALSRTLYAHAETHEEAVAVACKLQKPANHMAVCGCG